MGVSEDSFDDDLTPRDIVLLKARVENPTVSVRKIRDILEDEYGISLSHNRVNELLHEMETDEVLQTQVSLSKNSVLPVIRYRLKTLLHDSADRFVTVDKKRTRLSYPAITSATAWPSGSWPDRHSLSRLCVAENNDHSACAPFFPRNRNRSQPRVTC
jgi:hypothetical protein